ncbi:MAG TPA: hypothetical protein PKK95_09215 [Vicinamibacterales bacterium]|nr:hypothetical protein [Vicinamibacterales bacterium]
MAVDPKKLAIGGCVVYVADWAANGGATGWTDVGLTEAGSELTDKSENALIGDGDQVPCAQRAYPSTDEVEIKIVMKEADLAKLVWALQQPAANLTGTAPNQTLLRGARTEQYKAIKLETAGNQGPTLVAATRTITAHRCYIKSRDGFQYGLKDKSQMYGVTLGVLWDATVTTEDKLYKIVDSGGA